MRTLILIIMLFVAAPVYAGPMDHYTKCDGSWDGTGMTACEILGVPGVIITPGLSFNPYSSFDVLYEITALDDNNELLLGNVLAYLTGERTYTSDIHPEQLDDESLIIGIEVVRLNTTNNVPEPGSTLMLLLGGLACVGFIRR